MTYPKIRFPNAFQAKKSLGVASSDPHRLFNEDGTLKASKDWDEDLAKASAGFEVGELFEGKGDDKKLIGYLKRVKLNDRNPAQHDLMEYARLFPDRGAKIDLEVHGDMNLTNIELSARAIWLIKQALERKKEAENQAAAKILPKPE